AAGSPGAGGVLGQKRAGGLSRRLTERTPGEPGGAAERRGPDLTDTRRGEDSERADGRVRGSAMITSAAGIISLLDEEEPQLKEFALHKLNAVVNDFWAEISESVDKM
uniref:26S proteasome non-ATPase regulatory subunit 1/RPN2 N-terminal domain-containing protein n=1 Tax=Castor canadensis TaxID=51338 RepID=A0A8C0W3S2_CASCN